MKNNKILCVLLSVFFASAVLSGCVASQGDLSVSSNPSENTQKSSTIKATEPYSGVAINIPQHVIDEANRTISEVKDGEDIATDETVNSNIKEEATVVDEGLLETDGTVEQENISYDGTNSGKGKSLLGKCTGLTYYNQSDVRWANSPYTSSNNKSQTMKTSGCGPTSAAMIISSSKGAILPTTVADLFVANGYRTKINGTAWSAWSFVADYFGFNEYYTTSSTDKMLDYLKTDKNKDGVADYFVVASCGYGLFTTSGHYIVLVGDNSGTITVYDPYLYTGKFNTASRKAAKVTVSGNSAFVSESGFKKYGNANNFWIFSNDHITKTSSSAKKNTATSLKATKYVATKSQSLNVRSKASSSSKIITTLKRGTKVTVTKTNGSWSYITSPVKGWVSTAYLSSAKVTTVKKTESAVRSTTKYDTTVGKYYRLKTKTILYSKGSLSGTEYQYYAQTQVKVLSHYSKTVDKVKVVKTGRVAYVKSNNLK